MRTPLPDRDVSVESSVTRLRARQLCALALLQLATSCSALLPVPGAGLSPAQSERVDHARVFLHDGTELQLADATITPDSIVGFGGATSTRLAVARSDVATVDTRRPEPFTTFVAGACAAVAALFLFLRMGSA